MKVLITGSAGQLGSALAASFGEQAIALSRSEFDLTNAEMMREVIRKYQPEILINAAAYTQVDKAEEETDLSEQINSTAVKILAEACDSIDSVLVQLSTDYVFDSNSDPDGPWSETESVNPESVYAKTKLGGEQHALQAKKSFVIRTCGLYSSCPESPVRGRNFVDTMLALAKDRDNLSIVNDQTCTPTYIPHLVNAIQFLVTQNDYGLYHITNQGSVTWFDFASEIFRQADIAMDLQPISTEQYNAPAKRPRYSVLGMSKYEALNGPAMPDWKTGIEDYLKIIK